MGSKMKTKREQEVEKKKEEEEAAARAYEDFYHTFVDVADQKNKVWVKAGTYDAGSRKEDTKDRGKLYKPSSKLDELREKFSSAEKAKEDTSSNGNSAPSKSPFDKPDRPGKKKEKEKKKSNLELFKEELKMIQEERAERHKVKHSLREQNRSTTRFENNESNRGGALNHLKDASFGEESKSAGGTYDCGDPTTTNIYLANINPNTTEQRLMELFGRFGPLASVKIMWPRTDDERSRGRNCGFVAFMNRKDGERSLNALNGRMVDNFEMKLGWGKCVPIPPHPIYIPPALMELTLPPPPSGLPFNCQPNKKDLQRLPDLNNGLPTDIEGIKEMEQILQRAVVKVVIPTERTLLQLIHRMIEFVIQEGPIFEAMIMNKEIENPNFRFLFDNQSPAHIYYRWKLFSILQGDSQNKWSIKPFRMFANGSIWKPPPVNPFHQGMPEELIKKEEDFDDVNKKGSLSIAQRKRLESMIRSMTAERDNVAEVMVWCIEHAEAAHEICQCLTEALQNVETSFPKKIARLYLVSDILHNCTAKVANASFFRKYLQDKLVDMFIGLHEAHESMDSRLKAESMKQRVMKCVRAWEDWAVYPHDLLIRLQNIFLGLDVKGNSNTNSASQSEASPYANNTPEPPNAARGDPDIDGVPLDADGRDVNGASPPLLDGVSTTPLLKKSAAISALLGYDDGDDSAEDSADLDGAPIDDDLDGVPIKDSSPKSGGFTPGFVPSKWESVSPKKVEEQAMTLSKWDTLESNRKSDDDQDDSDTTPVYDRQAPGTPTDHDNVKKYDVADDEDDIDGVPLDDGVVDFPRRGRHSSRSPDGVRGDGTPAGGAERGSGGRRSRTAYEDDGNSSNEDRLQGDNDGKRSKLRAVEIKVLQYQDELERGVRPVKTGYTLSEQVQHYRHKLIKKVSRSEVDSSERRNRRRRSSSSEEKRPKRKARSPHKSRQRSRTPRRHRSRSPRRRGRSPQSKSPPRKHKKKRH